MPHPIYGHCWFDFDSKGNLGIECEHPPGDKHFLLKFLQKGGDMQHLVEAARVVVEALNVGGFNLGRLPAGKPGARARRSR